MFCNKCGDPVEANEKFCNKCGNPLYNIQNNQVKQNIITPSLNKYNHKSFNILDNKNKMMIFIGTGIGLGLFGMFFFILSFFGNVSKKYYFNTRSREQDSNIIQSDKNKPKMGKYSTSIVYDHTYNGVKIENEKDANDLIIKDSVNQKDNCPSDIKQIEDEIINNYGITAVNLCEMNASFARELGNVIQKIYNEYPSARGYITNLSLANVSMSDGYIAAFMPVFNFATSNSSSTYPWVIKTQVLLNTSYFLNEERLQASVIDGSKVGHFPPNTTIYSPVAHELGHYLSFLAMMKHYNMDSILLIDSNNSEVLYKLYEDFGKGDFSLQVIKEAYENYKRETNSTLSLDDWRGTISKYALAKDNSGNYIYDETIAESFHDVYLNENNASDASKYVVAVLKKKLGS